MSGKVGRVWLWLALALTITLPGCEDEASDVIFGKVDAAVARHLFAIEFPLPTPERKVRSLLGMQGSPASVVPNDPDIGASYEQYGFEVVRIPQDDFCSYTLEGIFQDPELPESEVASYDFGNIDRLVEAVVGTGAKVMWQATYDVGITGVCEEQDGRHAGQVLRDPTKQVNVVNNVLRHFNEGESGWDPKGREFDVRYVEYVNDPMGLGGYDLANIEEFFEHYQIFSHGIRAAFSGQGTSVGGIKIVGPAHRVRSWPVSRSGEKGFIFDFIDLAADQSMPLDVLSLQFRMDNPFDMANVVDDVREYLDQRALVEVPIWITEVAPSPTREIEKRAEGDEAYASYVASYVVASKIAWQETAERVFTHRGTRRYNGSGGELIESAFFDSEGSERGGLLAFNAFRSLADDTILRGSAVTSDGVAVLATRSAGGNSISVLAAYPGLDEGSEAQVVALTIDDLPDDIEELAWEFSEPSVPAPFIFQVQERGTIAVVDESIEYSFILEPSGVARLELTW